MSDCKPDIELRFRRFMKHVPVIAIFRYIVIRLQTKSGAKVLF